MDQDFIKKDLNFNTDINYLRLFLNEYWFAPQDVLLRSVEANIWEKCVFKYQILEIGIGDGRISKLIFLNQKIIDMGIDVDKEGINIAKENNKYKRVLCANAEKMPFENSSFKTVLSNSTFEHIKYDIKAVKEVSRVLKKNGLFFFTVPSKFLQDAILSIEQRNIKNEAQAAVKKFNKRARHLHYRNLLEWEKILSNNDFKIVYYKYYFPKDTTLIWYRLFKFSVRKFRNRELWSYFGHSFLRKFIPQKLVISLLEKYLNKTYRDSIISDKDGLMLFIVAKKVA